MDPVVLNSILTGMVFYSKTIVSVILSFTYLISSLPLHPYSPSPADAYRVNRQKYKQNSITDFPTVFSRDSKGKVNRSSSYFSHSFGAFDQNSKSRRSNLLSKAGIKRGLNIGVHVKFPTTTEYSNNLVKLENVLVQALGGRLGETLNTSGCPSCDEEEVIPGVPARIIVKPAYECDEWDAKFRICILERNIGDTVTFYLSTGKSNGHKGNVIWRKEFHIQDSNKRKEFIINAESSPENIIIGRKGYELRISPITETDIGYNLYSATIQGHSSPLSKVFFMIRIVPIDLGFVYVGETIELNLRSYVSLPAESITFRWYMEKDGEHGTLPSNMRTSASGSSIKISELRQEQEGILACSVYTNLDFLATKKRFRMKDLVKNNDVLKSTPNHNLHFKEDPIRGKRDPKPMVRIKREENIDDVVEKALMESTTPKKETHVTTTGITTRHFDDYDLRMDFDTPQTNMRTYESFPENLNGNRFPDQNQQIIGKGNLQTKQHEASGAKTSIEIDESTDDVPDIDSNSQMKSMKGDESPELESSMISQPMMDETIPEKMSLNKHTSYQKSNSGKTAKGKNHQTNELVDSETSNLHESNSLVNNKDKNKKHFVGIGIENKKDNYAAPTDESQIILNIDRIPGPRRISSEEKIAKRISSCYSDFECSGCAICVRSNLKFPGFCKCLPGFYGIGIFCREDIWLSKNNFDMDELHNLEDISYSNPSTMPQENI